MKYYPNKRNLAVGEYVYEALRRNIINFHLKPGDKISEKEVADFLAVSRTPVRESFIKLSKEGVVYVLPQRGTYVSKIDLSQVEEARFIRKSLEKSVMELAAEQLTESDWEELAQNIEQQKQIMQTKDNEKFLELDELFHASIYRSCNKKRTWEIIEQINTQYKRIRLLSFVVEKDLDKIIEQHSQLLALLKQRDKQQVMELTDRHLDKILTDQVEIRDQYPEYFVN